MVRRSIGAALSTFALAAASAVGAVGDDPSDSDGTIDDAKSTQSSHDQHGGPGGHLPASQENVDLVSKLRLTHEPERIADVGVHNGFAYIAAFNEPECRNGGMYVVDIRDPQHPKKVTFIKTSKGSFVGEGSQTITIDTPEFSGDLLAFNNEICDDTSQFANGGMTLVDVTDPASPVVLAAHAGDAQPDGSVNEIHSVFIWDAGAKAYAVLVDDEESTDVDIMDITDPTNPTMIREHDLAAEFPQILQQNVGLDEVFFHDVIVKEIGGRQVMLLSYWDAGYVMLDVTDPANATYIGDSDFTFPDPEAAESGLTVDPEGNGHEAEFTADNQYIVAADEDFGPYKAVGTNTTDGTEMPMIQGNGTPLPPGETLTGDTVFVGRACPGDPAVPPATAPNQFAVVERGLCTFTEKIAAVEAAGGYPAAIVFNREGADACSDLLLMDVQGNIPAVFVGRDTGFDLFDIPYDEAACRAGSAQAPIAIGTVGDAVELRSFFDGWGYVHLYRTGTGKLTELDTYAIPEAHDPAFAFDFGALSVHEAATSHADASLVYFAYYAGGFRVARISGDRLNEVGHFIDEGGNNFWGAQVFENQGTEYVAASDRDFGLYIFTYTGP